MILGQTVVEIFDTLAAGPVLRTFVQYLTTFCNRLEAAGDVISGMFVGQKLSSIRLKNFTILA